MTKRVFIIHGWEGTPKSNWFPWLKKELEKRGFLAQVPAMPNTNHPQFSQWLSHLRKIVGAPDEQTYFVGHSLGVITILRYLEALEREQRVGGAVLVAGFPELIGYDEIKSFFEAPLDYDKIEKSISRIVAIHSDNDPYVSIKNGEILQEKLGAKLIAIPKGGHFNEADGFTELPVVLDSLLQMSHREK